VATPVIEIHCWRFGVFEVDTRKVELRRDGKPVKIREQSFLILCYLLDHAGEIVAREELCRVLWPSDTFVDFDHSLNMAVMKLRETLGESTDTPLYIETIPRRGYRFIAPLSRVEHQFVYPLEFPRATSDPRAPAAQVGASEAIVGAVEGGEASTAASDSPPESVSRADIRKLGEIADATGVTMTIRRKLPWRWFWAAIFSAAIIAVLAATFWYLSRPLPPLRVKESARIIHDSNGKLLAGTDGARLYLTDSFRFYGAWESSIYQAAIDGGTLEKISPGAFRTWIEDISPDGSQLLVRSYDLHGQLGLWSMQVPVGAVRHLADTTHQYASWSPDGRLVVFWTDKLDIGVVHSDGTGAHILLPAESLGNPSEGGRFSWAPNGRTIRFTMDKKLWKMSTDGSGVRPLLPDWSPSSGQSDGQWTPDGRFFVFDSYEVVPPFTSNSTGPNQLWALDERRILFRRSSSAPVQLTSGPIRWITPIVSKDGRKIFARGRILDGKLERFDAQSHHFLPFLGGISAEYVSFSRDGQFVAYVTYPDGILWSANRDGSSRIQLTNPPMYPMNPGWSPDGTQVLFMVMDANRIWKAYLVPSHDRGTPQPLFPEDKGNQSDPNWSPDGRMVVFTTGTGLKTEIRILDLATRQTTILPGSAGMYSPRWSPDGRFISAIETRSLDLKVFGFEKQQWSLLHKGATLYPVFSQDGRYIYFVFWGENLGVYRVFVSGGKAERVSDLTDFRWAGAYSEWMGLDPTDAPMLLRDIGSDDIYALTLETK